jgi:protein-S-isoprenylcysteine O-methyltransferase Ste14
MTKLMLFVLVSLPLIFLSRKSIFNPHSHGFFRFFGWECIAWLLSSNWKYWFADPLGIKQVISWTLLLISLYYVVAGFVLLKKLGKPEQTTSRESLFLFERTTGLVNVGIFEVIRHPMYGSLIFLSWGIFLKNGTTELLIVTLASTLFFYFTALQDEDECIGFFGDAYRDYKKSTKMFIPFLW